MALERGSVWTFIALEANKRYFSTVLPLRNIPRFLRRRANMGFAEVLFSPYSVLLKILHESVGGFEEQLMSRMST